VIKQFHDTHTLTFSHPQATHQLLNPFHFRPHLHFNWLTYFYSPTPHFILPTSHIAYILHLHFIIVSTPHYNYLSIFTSSIIFISILHLYYYFYFILFYIFILFLFYLLFLLLFHFIYIHLFLIFPSCL